MNQLTPLPFEGLTTEAESSYLEGTFSHDDQVAVDQKTHPHPEKFANWFQEHVFAEPQEDEARQYVAHAEQADAGRTGY